MIAYVYVLYIRIWISLRCATYIACVYTFLQFPKDTLDAVFDIVEQSTEKEGNLAFQALVCTVHLATLVCQLQCVHAYISAVVHTNVQ